MPVASDADGQVKFLITCIAHSHNGSPDFGKVAEALGINKGAASSRYSRLLKAHGYNRDGTAATDTSASPGKPKAPRTPKTPRAKKSVLSTEDESPIKKRKVLSDDVPVKPSDDSEADDTKEEV